MNLQVQMLRKELKNKEKILNLETHLQKIQTPIQEATIEEYNFLKKLKIIYTVLTTVFFLYNTIKNIF